MFFYFNDNSNENNGSNVQITEENIANKILDSAMVDYTDVPIDIEKVLKNYGFSIGVTVKFANDRIIAGIAYVDKPLKHLNAQKFFIFRKDIQLRDRRYLMALGIAIYVMHSKKSYMTKSLYEEFLTEDKELNSIDARIARAILMPQKSLSTLIMSPMINKLSQQEQVENVAKAFLVSDEIATLRLRETGLI